MWLLFDFHREWIMLTILAEIGDRLSDHSHSALNDQLHYQYLCVEELQAGGGGGAMRSR